MCIFYPIQLLSLTHSFVKDESVAAPLPRPRAQIAGGEPVGRGRFVEEERPRGRGHESPAPEAALARVEGEGRHRVLLRGVRPPVGGHAPSALIRGRRDDHLKQD